MNAPRHPDEPGDEWSLSAGQVARMFGVSTATIDRWADRGRVPSIRTRGGHRRFRLRDVIAYREQTRPDLSYEVPAH